MLNPVRPWTALQNCRTEKPLITASLPPFSACRHTISVHLNQTNPAQKRYPPHKPHAAVMCIPVCMWRRWPPIRPPSPHAVCTSPLVHVLTPCPDEMARTSVWLPSDDLLVLSSTDESPHKGGIDPHKTHLLQSAAFVCVFVCLCVSTVPQGPHSLTAHPTTVPSQPRFRTPQGSVGTRSQAISLELFARELVLCLVKG